MGCSLSNSVTRTVTEPGARCADARSAAVGENRKIARAAAHSTIRGARLDRRLKIFIAAAPCGGSAYHTRGGSIQKNGGWAEGPSPKVVPLLSRLEHVPQRKLDVATFLAATDRQTLGPGDAIGAPAAELVGGNTHVHVGVVEEVVELGPELELVAFPRHLEVLQDGEVHVPEARSP